MVFSALVDLLSVVQACGHVSFLLFGCYPFALSRTGYFVLRASDAVLHCILYARDGDPIHLALYASHVLKGNVPLIRNNVFMNSVDTLSYLYTVSKIKDIGVFLAGCGSYAFLKTRGRIW